MLEAGLCHNRHETTFCVISKSASDVRICRLRGLYLVTYYPLYLIDILLHKVAYDMTPWLLYTDRYTIVNVRSWHRGIFTLIYYFIGKRGRKPATLWLWQIDTRDSRGSNASIYPASRELSKLNCNWELLKPAFMQWIMYVCQMPLIKALICSFPGATSSYCRPF